MPFHTTWHDETQSIIVVTTGGAVAWSELHAANDELVQMMNSVAHRVDIIFDSQGGMPPGNPLPHFKVTGTKLTSAGNLGVIVNVSASRVTAFIKPVVDIISRAYGMDMSHSGGYVGSIEDALTAIKMARAKTAAKKSHV